MEDVNEQCCPRKLSLTRRWWWEIHWLSAALDILSSCPALSPPRGALATILGLFSEHTPLLDWFITVAFDQNYALKTPACS